MDILSIIFQYVLPLAAIATSICSLVVVIRNNRKKTKSDQFKVAFDINYRIEDIDSKLGVINERFNSTSPQTAEAKKQYLNSSRDYCIEKLNTLEFLSLLINKQELTNESILKHFRRTLIEDTDEIFVMFPEWKTNEKKYEQLKKLLKRFEEGEFKD